MDRLLSVCEKKFSPDKIELLKKAIDFAKTIHQGQKRESSEPYYVHPEAVALILVDMEMDAVEWAVRAVALGAGEILLTSMDADGTKAGYDTELTRTIADAVEVPVIASGGAGRLEDFRDAFIAGHAEAALAASLFHYKELTIGQVKEYLYKEGIPVRR